MGEFLEPGRGKTPRSRRPYASGSATWPGSPRTIGAAATAAATRRRRTVRTAPPWIIGTLLFVCVLSGYLLSFTVDQPAHNGDWFLRYQVACRIVEHNRFTLAPYQADARSGPGLGGGVYTQYTLGQTTALIPFYLLGRVLGGVTHTTCADPAPAAVLLTGKLLDPILGAVLCVLFFALARLLGYAPPLAVGLTLLLAFATPLWPDVQSNLEHTLESLLLLVATYAAVRYTRQRHRQRLWVGVIGLAAGLEVVVRVSGVVIPPLFVLYLYILHRYRRKSAGPSALRADAAAFAWGLAPALIVAATFNALRFGSPLRTAPFPDDALGLHLLQGLPALLFSPGKGLLWYSPAVMLLVLVARPFARRQGLPTLLFASIVGVYLLFYANLTYWPGDPAWGPRYLYPVLPYLILPLGELWRRGRASTRSIRAVVQGVLICSFLVQSAAVSVSYWRWEHHMFAAHVDQAVHYTWGWDLNYYWRPDQSPLLAALTGVGDVARYSFDSAPSVHHLYADERYGRGNESCIFRIRGQAALCLIDGDILRLRENLNTYTFWWLHDLPWWGRETTTALVLVLLAAGASGAAGLRAALVPRAVRSRKGAPAPSLPASAASAAALAALAYGGLVLNAAAHSSNRVAPLLFRVPAGRTVSVDNLSYSVRVATAFTDVQTPGVAAPPPGYRNLVVLLRLRNRAARPWSWNLHTFALTDIAGRAYPIAGALNVVAAAFYHVPLLWTPIPPRSTVEVVEAFWGPATARRLFLLGPGVALIPLSVVPVHPACLAVAMPAAGRRARAPCPCRDDRPSLFVHHAPIRHRWQRESFPHV